MIRMDCLSISFERDNVNDHRAAAIDLQAEKAARPAAPCASYCYHAFACADLIAGGKQVVSNVG